MKNLLSNGFTDIAPLRNWNGNSETKSLIMRKLKTCFHVSVNFYHKSLKLKRFQVNWQNFSPLKQEIDLEEHLCNKAKRQFFKESEQSEFFFLQKALTIVLPTGALMLVQAIRLTWHPLHQFVP